MKYVYIQQSALEAGHFYVGLTDDVLARLETHNAGRVSHTSKFRPWMLKNSIGFADHDKAVGFEKYLKSGSGRAFAKKRL